MGQKISISEFTIKVRLDSAAASKGLRRFERQLKTFKDQMAKVYAAERGRLNAIKSQVSAIGGATKAQKRWNAQTKEGAGTSAQIVKSFKTLRSWAMAGLGFYAVKGLVSGIYNQVKNIVNLGSKVQQGFMTLDAAVGASDVASGLSDEALKKLKTGQKLFAENLASTYGLSLKGTLSNYAKFFAASSNYIGAKGSQDLFTSLSKLGVVYGLSAEKMNRAMTAFTQMASKNQVMAEELKQQLGDVLPGSMEIFARAMTRMGKYGIVTVEKLYDMMAKGKIVASEVLPYVTEEMNRMSAGSLAEALNLLVTRMNVFKTSLEIFSTGALNQFGDTLGRIFTLLSNIFKGKGFQTRVGQWINSFLEGVLYLLEKIEVGFKDFEKAFREATDIEGKWETLDNFWTYIFQASGLKKAIRNTLDKIDSAVFKPLQEALTIVIAEAIANGFKLAWKGLPSFSDIPSLLRWKPFENFGFSKEALESLEPQRNWNIKQRTPLQSGPTIIIDGGINTEIHGSNNPSDDAIDVNNSAIRDINEIIPSSWLTSAVV